MGGKRRKENKEEDLRPSKKSKADELDDSDTAPEDNVEDSVAYSTPRKNSHQMLVKADSVVLRDRFATGKIINDPIHGHIELPGLITQIIDTPYVQRLRFVKQLGAAYLVYPGADHTRFEHSVGVCHLGGKLIRTLQYNQPALRITKEEVICVQIAGLCHDLGHGPFSHMFDGPFLAKTRPGCTWTHEDSSLALIDHMLENHPNIKQQLCARDWLLVKELINPPQAIASHKNPWPCKSRGQDRCFLFQIIANKFSGIDVDKWDYFERDCMRLNKKSNFDYSRLLKFVKVLPVGERNMLCYGHKEMHSLFDMFALRKSLHYHAYQHPVGNVYEEIICEAFVETDKQLVANLKLPKDQQNQALLALFFGTSISGAIDDMQSYLSLTDSIMERIAYSTEPCLEKARSYLQMIFTRQHWKFVDFCTVPHHTLSVATEAEQLKVRQEIAGSLPAGSDLPSITEQDIFIQVVDFNYGMKKENPLDKVWFYRKSMPQTPFMIQSRDVSNMLPEQFSERVLRIYSKKRDQRFVDSTNACFLQWCQDKGFRAPGGEVLLSHLTPNKKTAADSRSSVTPGVQANSGNPRKSAKKALSLADKQKPGVLTGKPVVLDN